MLQTRLDSFKTYRVFWILWIPLIGFILGHLFLLSTAETTTDLWGASLLTWIAIAYLLWHNPQFFKLTSTSTSVIIGSALLSWILFKSTHIFTYDIFLRLYPTLVLLSFVLLVSGFASLTQYGREFFLLSFFVIPWELLSLLNLSLLTAKFSTFLLYILDFPVSRQEFLIYLPGGSVEVYDGCSGIRLMVQLAGIAFVILALSQPRKRSLLGLPLAALGWGFVVNGIRVALMAIFAGIPDPESLDYWHHGAGSLWFSFIGVVCLGLTHLWLNQSDPGGSSLDNPLPPGIEYLNSNTQARYPFNRIYVGLLLPLIVGLILAIRSLFPIETQTPKPIDSFPTQIPLQGWTQYAAGPVNTERVRSPAYLAGQFISGKAYYYDQNGIRLTIEMRYLIDTQGDLKSFIQTDTHSLQSTLVEKTTIGSYSLYQSQDQIHLSACINSRGGSTVTSDQFKRNRLRYDGNPHRIFSWIKGQTNLQDRRCLWAHLSIPLQDLDSTRQGVQILETVATDWFPWWQHRFPEE